MLFLDAPATRAALPMTDAITAMQVAFSDDRELPPRTLLRSSLFMAGRAGDYLGIKVVSIVPGNPAGIVAVFGPDGGPIGIVDGPTLTAIRTGAGCGLATKLLAGEDANVMAMIGAGAMAFDQVEAVRSVRPVTRVLVWSRDRDKSRNLAQRLQAEGVRAETAADPNQAVALADIVSCATPSREPVFSDHSVKPGTHINAIGAFTPKMCEVPAPTVRRSYVVVDDLAAAASEAGDLLQADRTPSCTLGDVLAGRHPQIVEDVTFFKSVGIASQDVAAAFAALTNAEKTGLGRKV